MPHWLYQNVLAIDDERAPQFALQSTQNWIRALRFEIDAEHGTDLVAQFSSCSRIFSARTQALSVAPPLAEVFEPLFGSLNYMLSAGTFADQPQAPSWCQPTAVIAWYYATYMASRAMFAASGLQVGDKHAAAERSFVSNLRQVLPHPLNMVARRTTGEKYESALPSYPGVASFDLTKAFQPVRAVSQGMLLQYLTGTASYHTGRTKERILADNRLGFTDFRTQAARSLRDSRLAAEIGLMHCAYRYRGKANYRDAIYLTYGSRPQDATQLLSDLAGAARFAFACALALVHRRLGAGVVGQFARDLEQHLRDFGNAPPDLQNLVRQL